MLQDFAYFSGKLVFSSEFLSMSELKTNVYIKELRGGSRAAATSKMECFVIIVNSWKPLTIITKHFILDVAAVLDPPLGLLFSQWLIPMQSKQSELC